MPRWTARSSTSRWPPTSWCESSRHADRNHHRHPGALRPGRMMDDGSATPEIVSLMKRNSCGKAHRPRPQRPRHAGGNGIGRFRRHPAPGEPGSGQYLRRQRMMHRPDPRPGANRNFGLSEPEAEVFTMQNPPEPDVSGHRRRPGFCLACSATVMKSPASTSSNRAPKSP